QRRHAGDGRADASQARYPPGHADSTAGGECAAFVVARLGPGLDTRAAHRGVSPPPAQIAPAGEATPAGEGRFLVSITSQPTEAEAQSSFRSMQQKHPDQLGSR